MDCALHWLVTVEKKKKQDSGRAESALDLNTPEIQNVYRLSSMWTKKGSPTSLVYFHIVLLVSGASCIV